MSNPDSFQVSIEKLLEKFKAQPVGTGYIDLILEKESALVFIDELSSLPAAVERMTWWCHVTPETKQRYGCPHGIGGPGNQFGEGWFGECVHYHDFEVQRLSNPTDENSLSPKAFAEKCNQLAINYIKNILPTESFYSPCLYPGIWIYVSPDWTRKFYFL